MSVMGGSVGYWVARSRLDVENMVTVYIMHCSLGLGLGTARFLEDSMIFHQSLCLRIWNSLVGY
jgi:hypothetical protein